MLKIFKHSKLFQLFDVMKIFSTVNDRQPLEVRTTKPFTNVVDEVRVVVKVKN